MKKIVILLFSGAMILALCSCSSSSEAVNLQSSESITQTTENNYTPETAQSNIKDDVNDWMKDNEIAASGK